MSTPEELLAALGREARARFGNGSNGAMRTYRGRSVEQLLPRIQQELGEEAIIVRRREGLTGGVLGFFQHPFVEIEAMHGPPGIDLYDEADSLGHADSMPFPPPVPPVPEQHMGLAYQPAPHVPVAAPAPSALPHVPAPAQAPPPPQAAPVEAAPPPQAAPAQQAAPAPAPQVPPAVVPPAPEVPPAVVPPAPAVLQEGPAFDQRLAPTDPQASPPGPAAVTAAPPTPFYLLEPPARAPGAGSSYVSAQLTALARAEQAEMDRPRSSPSDPALARPGDPPAWGADSHEQSRETEPEVLPRPFETSLPRELRAVGLGSYTRARAGVAKSLRRFGISEELAHELMDGASAHALPLAPRSGLARAVRTTLAQRIPTAPALPTTGAAIVVVGAGGAGKTSCCATLLSAYRRSSSLRASCATITREGERGELRMLLSPHIMAPCAALTPRALRVLRMARREGVAVLDTPSLSPSDRAGIRELARLLAELKPERVVVALPATLGATAASQLLEAIRPLGANAVAVTHADETDQIGVAVEVACRFGLAPEYILDRNRNGGWRLRPTSPIALAEKLLP